MFLISVIEAQNTYIQINHPVYPFLEYLESSNKLSRPILSHRPLMRNYILKQLQDIHALNLTEYETKMVNHYISQLLPIERQNRTRIGGALTSKDDFRNSFRNIWQYEWDIPELHLLSYQDSVMVMTFDWTEKIRYENWTGEIRRIDEDDFLFTGQIGDNIVWSSEMIRYREFYNDRIEKPPIEFKQAVRQPQKGGDYYNWDETHGYIVISANIFQFDFARQSFLWSSANEHSLVFSNNSAAFPFLGFQINHRKVYYQYFHGMIMSVADSVEPKSQIEFAPNKYIVAHRIEISPIKKLSLVYSEIDIYSRESPELGYVLPVTWLKPLQHGLGDKDNLLIALEGKYTISLLGQIYGTVLFDEFARVKMFTNWWANKQGYQIGMKFPWKVFNRPNMFKTEFTAIRPWVYTHKLDVNTYTHNMRGLGFPYGPNSQLIYIADRFMPNERWNIQFSFSQLRHGEPNDDYPIGSDPNDNNYDRNKAFDDATYFLMGNVITTETFRINIDYRFSNTLWVWCGFEAVQSNGQDNTILQFGVKFDY